MSRLWFVLLPWLVLSALLPGRVVAEEGTMVPGSPDDQAQALSDEGVMAYRAGRFDEAIRLFKQAHQLRADPILLYNLARIYEKQGKAAEALEYYRRYLVADDTEPKLRARAEQRVAKLSVDLQGKGGPAPHAPPRPGRTLLWTGVGLGAAGVAVLVTGIGLDGAGFSDFGQFKTTTDEMDKRALEQTAHSLGVGAVVCYVAGAALLGGGGALIALGIRKGRKLEKHEEQPASGVRAAVLPVRQGAALVLAGRF